MKDLEVEKRQDLSHSFGKTALAASRGGAVGEREESRVTVRWPPRHRGDRWY